MKKAFIYILIAVLIIIPVLSGCEDVIDIDFENLDQQIVIEGMITDSPAQNKLVISKSRTIFQSTEKTKISGAVVTVSDGNGNVHKLVETLPGIFNASVVNGSYGDTYSLAVEFGGKLYTAVSKMPDPMNIDSINFKIASVGFFPFTQNYYKMNCYLSNIAGREEYCLLKISGGSFNGAPVYMLYQDKYSDGKQVVIDRIPANYYKNETATVELYSIDKNAYDFYLMLKDIAGDEGIDVPEILNMNSYNPKSNISNNALGYFGAFAYKKYTVKVK